MQLPSSLTEPGSAQRREDDTEWYRHVLHGMIGRGADLVELTYQQASQQMMAIVRNDLPPSTKGVDYAARYELISKAVRRCIMLARSLVEPPKPLVPDSVVARKRIIREVEDKIARQAEPADRDGLEIELAERMETLDYDADISGRPIDEVIAEIARDLGIEPAFDGIEWKRRTPEDIRKLCALAAAGIKTPAEAGPVPFPPSWLPDRTADCDTS